MSIDTAVPHSSSSSSSFVYQWDSIVICMQSKEEKKTFRKKRTLQKRATAAIQLSHLTSNKRYISVGEHKYIKINNRVSNFFFCVVLCWYLSFGVIWILFSLRFVCFFLLFMSFGFFRVCVRECVCKAIKWNSPLLYSSISLPLTLTRSFSFATYIRICKSMIKHIKSYSVLNDTFFSL